MLETATTQPDQRAAFDRAHAERAQAFKVAVKWAGSVLASMLPTAKTKRADQTGQPLNCDCPA